MSQQPVKTTTFNFINNAIYSIAVLLFLNSTAMAETLELIPSKAAVGQKVEIYSNNLFTSFSVVKFAPDITAVRRLESASKIVATVPANVQVGEIRVIDRNGIELKTSVFTPEPRCNPIVSNRSVLLTEGLVVNNPKRTRLNPADPTSGAWSFGRLMERLAPAGYSAAQLDQFVRSFFAFWERDFYLNGYQVKSRAPIKNLILNRWPRTPEGYLDLTKAPFRLLAIGFRLDLGGAAGSNQMGEGRLVFGMIDQQFDAITGGPFPGTLIFEYGLRNEVISYEDMIQQMYDLSSGPLDETMLSKIERLTDIFSKPNVKLSHLPNSIALNNVRTNEALLRPGIWELRGFQLTPSGDSLAQVPLAQTPDEYFKTNEQAALAAWVYDNREAVEKKTHVLSAEFMAGTSITSRPFFSWTLPSSELTNTVKTNFSKATCNGCHGAGTIASFLPITLENMAALSVPVPLFTHIEPRGINFVSRLSHALANEELPKRRLLLKNAVINAFCK